MEQLIEPSTPPSSTDKPVIPQMGLREIQATYEMLVNFKEALKTNEHWHGTQVQAVAMGLQWVISLEGQYRGQLEAARRLQKEEAKNATRS